MCYEDFIKDHYPIYFSMKEAKCKGYESHHIIPKSLGGTDEDGLVRLTPYEHIYAHYLLALENPKAIPVFFCMVNINQRKLMNIQKVSLEDLYKWSELRKQGLSLRKGIKGKRAYNNGKVVKYFFEGEEPAGFIIGNLNRGISFKERVGNLNYIDPRKGKTAKEIYGEDYVNPKKGKTAKELYGDNYISPLKGKTFKEIRGENYKDTRKGKTNSLKGKTAKEIYGENYISPLKGRSNTFLKNKKWFNNGIISVMANECPKDFVPGRIYKRKNNKNV